MMLLLFLIIVNEWIIDCMYSVEVGQQSVEDVVVLVAQLLQLGYARRPVVVLLLLVLLQGRLGLVDLPCEPLVRQQNQKLHILVVSAQELFHCLWSVGVEGPKRVVEPHFLLVDPGESAFLDEDAGG